MQDSNREPPNSESSTLPTELVLFLVYNETVHNPRRSNQKEKCVYGGEKACQKREVLSLLQKVETDGESRTISGKLFQLLGAM